MLARALNLTAAENCILAGKVGVFVLLFLLEIAALSTGPYSSPKILVSVPGCRVAHSEAARWDVINQATTEYRPTDGTDEKRSSRWISSAPPNQR